MFSTTESVNDENRFDQRCIISNDKRASYIVREVLIKNHKPIAPEIVNLCRTYGLIGYKLSTLFDVCCNKDEEKLQTTFNLLSFNKIPAPVVAKNLNMKEALPFLPNNVPDEFKVNRSILMKDAILCSKFAKWAEEVSKELVPKIEKKYKEYIETLQKQ